MELIDGIFKVPSFLSVTLGIIVLFIGKRINEKVSFLREFSIPEPVTGGLIFSMVFALVYLVLGVTIQFDLYARDFLLVYFFTTIGINASLKDLKAGGKPLLILLAITIGYMFVQNMTGIAAVSLFDMSPQVGVLGGTVSLIGGHGTAIAWAPRIAEQYNIDSAMEIGIACATFGLILASLQGGPVAKYLISRHKLSPDGAGNSDDVRNDKNQHTEGIDQYDFLDAIIAIHVSIIFGVVFDETLKSAGIDLPLFVSCLFAGILITNFIPKKLVRLSGRPWPTRSPAIALIANISLGAFLSMSLMSMQLWTLLEFGGPILVLMIAQFAVAVCVTIFVVFPAMGKNYDAAVISAGFGGISLGATPTAMANMAAVTQRYGDSHLAFIIVPLVCAFFIDIANAIIIPFFLNLF